MTPVYLPATVQKGAANLVPGPGTAARGRNTRWRWLGLALLFLGAMAPDTSAQNRYLYAIENLDQGGFVRSGQTGEQGIPTGRLFLGPETRYRAWFVRASDLEVGFAEFATGTAGTPFAIPAITFLPAPGDDADRDGLSDLAERILGTNPLVRDTDGDGVTDGEAIRLGVDAGARRVGVVGGAPTEGEALDVCAINNLAIVAEGERGISVFNIFERLVPLAIARVRLPGRAVSVACSGDLIAVAVGSAGVQVVDLADPPAARVVRSVSNSDLGGGEARVVAATAGLTFVGTSAGRIGVVELATGGVFQQADAGGAVDDLAVSGATLFALAGSELRVLAITNNTLVRVGSVAVSTLTADGLTGRKRLFVGGGMAYATAFEGYETFDVTDPTRPRRLGTVRGVGPRSFKQIVPNGSGLGLAAVGLVPGSPSDHEVYLYDLRDPAVTDRFQSVLETPGVARALALYNGLAYVADGAAGLQVLNYLPLDTAGNPPEGRLWQSVTNDAAVGSLVVLRADVQDDVQIRNVEFYANDRRVAVVGGFPFETAYRLPVEAVGAAVAFRLLARDTGGNALALTNAPIRVLPDTQPPVVRIEAPTANQRFFVGDPVTIRIAAADNVGIGTVALWLNGAPVPARRVSATDYLLLPGLPSGTYRVQVLAVDTAGLQTLTEPTSFAIWRGVVGREYSVFNAGSSQRRGAVSREYSVFNHGGAQRRGAISREYSVERR